MRELGGAIRQVLAAEQRMTDGDLPAVCICGETGTGKELVARALHFDGARRDGPFVEINCASIPAHLIEAELFGHEKGAFTDVKERRMGLVESADGGTLFLDEIGEIDMVLQAKLLKLLEEKTIRRVGAAKERKVNLRIISANNRDLEPNLRFSDAAERVLLQYPWPGNVRELRNMLEQTVLLAPTDLVAPKQLALCPGLGRDPSCDRDFQGCEQSCMSLPKSGVNLAEIEKGWWRAPWSAPAGT